METSSRKGLGLAALIATVITLAGCASTPAAQPAETTSGVKVVASTTWQAMFATAAGADDVTVIVPASAQHAAEYDPTPSDLTALSGADFVLYSDFESFVPALTEAADSDSELIAVNADNTPDNIIAEVERLGDAFGTSDEATQWVAQFRTSIDGFRDEIAVALGADANPTIVSQVYVTWLADLISDEVDVFGPAQPTVSEVHDLAAAGPRLVLDNIHMSAGRVLPDSDVIQVNVVNYPESDLDVIALYRLNVDKVIAALNGHAADDVTEGGTHGDAETGHDH